MGAKVSQIFEKPGFLNNLGQLFPESAYNRYVSAENFRYAINKFHHSLPDKNARADRLPTENAIPALHFIIDGQVFGIVYMISPTVVHTQLNLLGLAIAKQFQQIVVPSALGLKAEGKKTGQGQVCRFTWYSYTVGAIQL